MVLSVVCAYASCNRYRMMYSIPDTLSPAWILKDCCSPFIYREWTAWPYWTWAPTSWQQFLTCTVCRGWKNSIWRAIRSETPRSQQALHMWRTWMQSCLATTTSPRSQIKRLQFWPALPCVAWTLPAMASGESTPGVGYVAHTMQHAAQHNTTQPPPLLPPPPHTDTHAQAFKSFCHWCWCLIVVEWFGCLHEPQMHWWKLCASRVGSVMLGRSAGWYCSHRNIGGEGC